MFAFRLGSIPVRVHVSFLLVAAFIGMSGREHDLRTMLMWIVVVFVGVLLHELGHALMARSFGLAPEVHLAGLGGVTVWRAADPRAIGPGKRVAISVAGPLVGIVLGGAVLAYQLSKPIVSEETGRLLDAIVFVNLGWGVLNMIPILPMDGGNVMFQILERITGGKGETPARIVSILLCVAGGLYLGLHFGDWIWAIYPFGMFAAMNVQAMRGRNDAARDAPVRTALREGFDALARNDTGTAARIARDVLARDADSALRADAVRLLAFSHLTAGAWGPLMELMESPASAAIGDDELGKFEQAARELGRPEEATRIGAIRAARAAGPQGPQF